MNDRLRNHLSLGAISAASLGIAAWLGGEAAAADNISIVSAYLCLLLFSLALLIGPARVWRGGAPILNTHMRRDIGIWGGLTGLVHFFLANALAMNFEYLGLFVENATVPPSAEVRDQLYLWGTILGYVVALLILVLLALSSDRVLRAVGARWWKRLQRLSYVVFVATVLHAFAFQILETRPSLWVVVVSAITLVVIGMQLTGFAKNRWPRTP